jgi:hypothetical protein
MQMKISNGAMVEWYWQGKTEVVGEKHYTAWVVDGWMSMEQWWNDTDKGKLKYWEKNIIQLPCRCMAETCSSIRVYRWCSVLTILTVQWDPIKHSNLQCCNSYSIFSHYVQLLPNDGPFRPKHVARTFLIHKINIISCYWRCLSSIIIIIITIVIIITVIKTVWIRIT